MLTGETRIICMIFKPCFLRLNLHRSCTTPFIEAGEELDNLGRDLLHLSVRGVQYFPSDIQNELTWRARMTKPPPPPPPLLLLYYFFYLFPEADKHPLRDRRKVADRLHRRPGDGQDLGP